LRPRSVTADAAYGTRENIAAIEKAGIRAYAALPEQGGRTGLFTIEDFVYDAEKDLYTCPRGETLHRFSRRSLVRTSENASNTHSGRKRAYWFKYANTHDTRVDVSSPAHKGRRQALRVGENLAIKQLTYAL
jgi:hypothetical protein